MPACQARQPKVSILVAAYNASRFLAGTLDDLLAQTFSDFELVVVEDGSTDGTLSLLQSYAARDPRIVVVQNDQNMGLPRSLNRGLERCRAPLVARADADDRYPPDRLERQVQFMEAHPDVGILSGAIERIDENGSFLFRRQFPTEDGQIRLRELFVNSLPHPAVMYRKHLVDLAGGYDPAYFTAEDSDLWSRLRRMTRAANLDALLVYYRRHGAASMSNRGPREEALSLGVRQRELSHYLERAVSMDEARAMNTLFCGYHRLATLEELAMARSGIREVLRQAKKRENPAAVRYFQDEISTALLKQADLHGDLPSLRLDLTVEALRLAPRTALAKLKDKLKRLPARLVRSRKKAIA